MVILVSGCENPGARTSTSMEVFVTGNEQAIVDSLSSKEDCAAPRHYENSLDQALAVLLTRCYPLPAREKLIARTITSVRKELRRQSGLEVPNRVMANWRKAVGRTGSFETVLEWVGDRVPQKLDRAGLVNKGLQGMLAATGWRSACVLSTAQAAELEAIVKAREQSEPPPDADTQTQCLPQTSAPSSKLVEPGILYVKVPSFEVSGVGKHVTRILREHAGVKASVAILDLRDNRGGRPEEANGIADVLLDEKLLQVFDFGGGKRVAFKSNPGALDIDVIMLTNHITGSGAEMLVLALHDNKRAIIVGQTTTGALFGKDFQRLKEGQTIVFRSLPTVLSPTGTDFSCTGIVPDIVVADQRDSSADEVLERAIALARSHIAAH